MLVNINCLCLSENTWQLALNYGSNDAASSELHWVHVKQSLNIGATVKCFSYRRNTKGRFHHCQLTKLSATSVRVETFFSEMTEIKDVFKSVSSYRYILHISDSSHPEISKTDIIPLHQPFSESFVSQVNLTRPLSPVRQAKISIGKAVHAGNVQNINLQVLNRRRFPIDSNRS